MPTNGPAPRVKRPKVGLWADHAALDRAAEAAIRRLMEKAAETERKEKMLRVVVISGAGLSVESGIRPYRGPTGIYTEMQEKYGRLPEELVTTKALRKETELFWEFWSKTKMSLKDSKPNPAHYALVEIEKKSNFLEVTQNVDGLSFHAGMPPYACIELHGTAATYRCDRCGIACKPPELSEGMEVPRCQSCGDPEHAPIRPNVVLFGEMIKTEDYKAAFIAAKAADILITVGTSLQFGYLGDFVDAAMGNNAVIVDIDPDAVNDVFYDVVLPTTASEGLMMVNECLTAEMTDKVEFMNNLRKMWNDRNA